MKTWSSFATLLLLPGLVVASDPRGIEELTRCIKMAEPLVKDPENIFPLNNRDIERVCKLWDNFVRCVEDYTLHFLSSTQRQELNAAIESSVKSVNQLCVEDPEYRRSYIENAPCLKRVSMNRTLCGGQYDYLADLVQGLQATDAQMCCAHHKFRECVLDKTPRECDRGNPHQNTASNFMRSMLDRALGFLLQKCKNFVPNARDCPRGNFNTPTGPYLPSDDDNYNNNLHNPSSNNGGSILRPDATTLQPTQQPSPTTPTTRFTWTTPANQPTPRPTSDSSLNLAGNNLFGAESQQYRGSGSGLRPPLASLTLTILLAFTLF